MPPLPDLPAPLRARPLAAGDGDLDAVLATLLRSDTAELGEPDVDADDLRALWGRPGFDPAADAVVAEAPGGTVAGYAWSHRAHESEAIVDPEWRGRGLGRALLAWVVARAGEQAAGPDAVPPGGPHHLRIESIAGRPAAERLLTTAGFRPTRQTLLLGIDLAAPPAEPTWPVGVTARPFRRPGDDRPAHALARAAFADVEGTTPRSFEEWAGFALDRAGFDPALSAVAETADGDLAGVVVNHRFNGEGYVASLAVARPSRRRGLGEALLRRGFRLMADAGLPAATLHVDADNTTGAARLYFRAGMAERHVWQRWERPVGAADEGRGQA